MIPFALKQAWFWLALAGLVQCWITLVVVPGRRYGGLWGRLYYCIFVTLLEGIFCLGMIWHMDPSRMPRPFCIAQVISFSLASFALTGLCASFAVASALAVFRPQSFNSGSAVLAWHSRYIPLLIFFPTAASVTHITLLITLDAVKPWLSDDLHCDATDPIWMRLVGYAGVPLIVSIPFLVISFLTALRLYKMSHAPTRPTEIYSTTDAENGGQPTSTPTQSYELHENKRRNRSFRLTAFLPYPTLFSRSTAAVGRSSAESSTQHGRGGDEHDYPLHQHPFPTIDPLTGKPYSPSLEDRDGAPFTVTGVSPAANEHEHEQLHSSDERHSTERPQNRTRSLPDGRGKSSTPDSAFSSSMPVFASNPTIPSKTLAPAQASGTSIHLQNGGSASDVQLGLAITTGDSPMPSRRGSRLEEHLDMVPGEIMGLAITTDEPDARTITPISRLGTPSPQRNNVIPGPASPDAHTVHGTSEPQDSLPQLNSEVGSGDRARCSESMTRTLSSSMQILAHANHSAPHLLSSTFVSAPQAPSHHREPSFVSSATVYSGPRLLFDREDRDLLAFSPASASSFQSQMTPKNTGIDLVLNMGMRNQETEDGNQDYDKKYDIDADWDDDIEYDHGTGLPVRTVEPRDPRERLGVYNPTPSTPTAIMRERRRRKLQRKRELEERGSGKLGGAIWRMVLFQIAFFAVQLLASLSSILDVIHNRITPFGTQHVALLLAAWGPLFIFCHVPKSFRFWRRWQ